MMSWLNRALASILLCLAIPAGARNTGVAGPVVDAPAGPVRGEGGDGVNVFRGIPFALPPTGAQRWRPPVEVPAWREVRDATSFGPVCYQPRSRSRSIYTEELPPMSEDCLSLNIWAPAESKHAPVFVWIHGGNLVRGSSQLRTCGLRGDARDGRDLVVAELDRLVQEVRDLRRVRGQVTQAVVRRHGVSVPVPQSAATS